MEHTHRHTILIWWMSSTEETEEEDVAVVLPLAPLGEGLITLSTLPKSHWSNLQNLDVIKVAHFIDISVVLYNWTSSRLRISLIYL